jgi:hypothetical protein
MLNNCFRKRQKFSFKNEVANEIIDKSIPMFSKHQQDNINKNKTVKQVPLEYRIVFL